MLKTGDRILIAAVLVLAILVWAGIKFYNLKSNDTARIAVIMQDNKVLKIINLDISREPERIKVYGDYEDVILVEKGRIRFEEADCPDRICVKTGWLSKKGDTSVCLPNRTIVKIEGNMDKIDGVSY